MPVLTPLWRLLRVVLYLLAGAAIVLFPAAGRPLGFQSRWLPAVVCWWHTGLCRALDLRIQVKGNLAPNVLLVANHISWLDVPVLGAQGELDFLSKAEVRDWPLIGWMAESGGTLFINRGGHESAEVIRRLGERIRAGRRAAIFPEGTTTDGTRVRRFHPRLLAAAQQAGVGIQPVALRYGDKHKPDPIAPFIGNDSLVLHLLRLLRHPGLAVTVSFLPPVTVAGLDRRRLAEQCHRAIAGALDIEPGNPVREGHSPALVVPPTTRAAALSNENK